MCDTELPIPTIEKQKGIVKEYHILVDRIDLNNQLINKLEETSQPIYSTLKYNCKLFKPAKGILIFAFTIQNCISNTLFTRVFYFIFGKYNNYNR